MLDLLLTYQRNSRLQVCINNFFIRICSFEDFESFNFLKFIQFWSLLPRALLISSKCRKPAAKSTKPRFCYRCCLTILILIVNLSKINMIIIMEWNISCIMMYDDFECRQIWYLCSYTLLVFFFFFGLYRKAMKTQRKINKELRNMFNESAIFELELLTKILIVSIPTCIFFSRLHDFF